MYQEVVKYLFLQEVEGNLNMIVNTRITNQI